MHWIQEIGGITLYSCRAAALAGWYQRCLGLRFHEDPERNIWQSQTRMADRAQSGQGLICCLSIRATKSDFSLAVPIVEPKTMHGDQPYMLRLTTHNLDSLLLHLRDLDEPVLGQSGDAGGRCAWVRDLDGHRVELFEPAGGDA